MQVVLLTRDEHASGRWLLDLKSALERANAPVKILKLSEVHEESNSPATSSTSGYNVDGKNEKSYAGILVNRV